MSWEDKRKLERKRQRLRVKFGRAGQTLNRMGFTEDINAWGIFVATLKPEDVGQELWLEVDLPESMVQMRGFVVRKRSNPRDISSIETSGFGVRIDQAPEEWYTFLLQTGSQNSSRLS